MSGILSLEQFCHSTRDILKHAQDNGAREKIRQSLEALLANPDFIAEHCGPDREAGVEQIHHDEETDFYVLAHSYDAARQTPPHDHGSSWAIYGQAAGYTDMTVWNLTGQLDDEGTRIVEPVKRFRLDPPCAGVFHPGEIHSIHFTQGGRTVRVTGTDLSKAGQARFSPRPDTA